MRPYNRQEIAMELRKAYQSDFPQPQNTERISYRFETYAMDNMTATRLTDVETKSTVSDYMLFHPEVNIVINICKRLREIREAYARESGNALYTKLTDALKQQDDDKIKQLVEGTKDIEAKLSNASANPLIYLAIKQKVDSM